MSVLRAGNELSARGRRRSSILGEAAFLVSTAAAAWLGFAWLEESAPGPLGTTTEHLVSTAATSFLLCAAAVMLAAGIRGALAMTVVGACVSAYPMLEKASQAPVVGFVSFVWAAVAAYVVARRPPQQAGSDLDGGDDVGALWSPAVLASGVSGLVAAGLAVGYRLAAPPFGEAAVFALLLVPAVFATCAEVSLVRRGALAPWKAWGLTAATLLGAGLWALSVGAPQSIGIASSGTGLSILALRVLVAVAGASRAHELHHDLAAFLWRRPALLVVLTFVLLCAVGGILLKFPACTTRPINLIDALFTAVSASCVTGLVVLDTPVDFTIAGQCVILLLIQVGGLGIMTLSAFATLALGGSFGSAAEAGLSEMVGAATPRATIRLVRTIMLSTVAVEATGALLLFPAFLATGSSVPMAAWKSVFHAVSAFCNAGFALQSENLIPYRSNPWILFVVGSLIVLGGLGFGVLAGLYEIMRLRARAFGLHAKLVLTTTAILILSGMALFLSLEWNASLAGLSFADRVYNSFLQSITYRTAGFNSVDFSRITSPTILLGMVFMFIGASPASTGGGIKTTTAAILFLAVRAVLGQRGDVEAFGRRIQVSVVYRAAAVTTLSLAFVTGGIVLLLQTQPLPFPSLCFEAFSAFGTVGLSLGATPFLDPLGKIVIMGLMLAGRTGPLTMALLFGQAMPRRIRFLPEEVMVG